MVAMAMEGETTGSNSTLRICDNFISRMLILPRCDKYYHSCSEDRKRSVYFGAYPNY